MGIEFGPALREEWPDGLGCLFRRHEPAVRDAVVALAMAMADASRLCPAGLWVARDNGRIVAAILANLEPGRLGVIEPPGSEPELPANRRAFVEDHLVATAVAWLQAEGASLAHCLLPPALTDHGAALTRAGFLQPTTFRLYRRRLDGPWPRGPGRLEFLRHDDPAAGSFATTLLETYRETLDVPELDQRRSLHDILEGYRAQGDGTGHEWWLATAPGHGPVGVVLVTERPELGTWELLYLGLVPQARRRGWGHDLLAWVLARGRQAGITSVTVTVDARNAPALQLYEAFGFRRVDEHRLWLKFFADPVPPDSPSVS